METIDLTDTIIPFALLSISNRFKEMGANDVIEILGKGMEARSAVFKIIPESSRRIVCDEYLDSTEGAFRIRFQKIPDSLSEG